ncbi:hypothetical protein I5Q34_18680 [Streptomyces sp. AV19]|uniref:hypothetical protein n=1 Tax=Streptomyces sp. AV19 TaxID=2793068 RepID=UPI0018FE256A|nr:hypothetical protein [Streptomyces sp. AV19]MBH1936276.1 hypothetical protein [Streptomyces sp. AV19]MDG4532311.1 hypothetical protein [Streptomyces sp. AV19]
MAKNKKQDRSQQQKGGATERSQEQAQKSAMEAQSSRVTPADLAQKSRQKRFGHN